MSSIFISYAREDLPAAQKVARLLEGQGWDIWWDRELIAGNRFDEVIEQQLSSAAAVVVLWSRASVASEWVRSEASAAAERHVLVPARIDQTPAPLRFRMLHTVELSAWGGEAGDEDFQRLITSIEALAGPPPPRPASLPPPVRAVPTPPPGDEPTSRPVPVGGPIGAGPHLFDEPAPPPRRRHRARGLVIAAVMLAAVAVPAAALLRPAGDGLAAGPDGSSTTSAAPMPTGSPTTEGETPPSPPTTEHDGVPPPPPDPNVLQRGSHGDHVAQIQEWLSLLGYELSIDADFGRMTEGAVRHFEGDNGLPVDGKLTIGQHDWVTLRDLAQVAEQQHVDDVEVPDVFGWLAEDASATLHALGFEVNEIRVCSSSVGDGEVRQLLWTDADGSGHIVVDKPGLVADNRAPAGALLTVKVGNGQPCP